MQFFTTSNKPSAAVLCKLVKDDNRIEFNIGVDLYTIIDSVGIDGFNNLIDEICPDGHLFEDLSYKAVGADNSQPEQSMVIISVNADASGYLEEHGEPATCETCGEELDKDCQGEMRCPTCDGPCPHCGDGGGPV